mmetsp:Transcript_26943/g.82701  ORF Transcript_26943/g.82701 Transcript_26943/m.82701 type:complete len:279 (+) Transcript_26943:151-987(+)
MVANNKNKKKGRRRASCRLEARGSGIMRRDSAEKKSWCFLFAVFHQQLRGGVGSGVSSGVGSGVGGAFLLSIVVVVVSVVLVFFAELVVVVFVFFGENVVFVVVQVVVVVSVEAGDELGDDVVRDGAEAQEVAVAHRQKGEVVVVLALQRADFVVVGVALLQHAARRGFCFGDFRRVRQRRRRRVGAERASFGNFQAFDVDVELDAAVGGAGALAEAPNERPRVRVADDRHARLGDASFHEDVLHGVGAGTRKRISHDARRLEPAVALDVDAQLLVAH